MQSALLLRWAAVALLLRWAAVALLLRWAAGGTLGGVPRGQPDRCRLVQSRSISGLGHQGTGRTPPPKRAAADAAGHLPQPPPIGPPTPTLSPASTHQPQPTKTAVTMAKELLAGTQLSSVLPNHPLVNCVCCVCWTERGSFIANKAPPEPMVGRRHRHASRLQSATARLCGASPRLWSSACRSAACRPRGCKGAAAAAATLWCRPPAADRLPLLRLSAVTTGCRMESAIKILNEHKILSVPVLQKDEVG